MIQEESNSNFVSYFRFSKLYSLKRRQGCCFLSSYFFRKILFDLSCFNCLIFIFGRQHTAPYTLHSVLYALDLHLQMPLNLNMSTSYYTLKTVHCTPHIYTAFFNCITSYCKPPKFESFCFKIYIAKCTLMYWPS